MNPTCSSLRSGPAAAPAVRKKDVIILHLRHLTPFNVPSTWSHPCLQQDLKMYRRRLAQREAHEQ